MLTGQREGTRDLAVTLVTLLLVLAWDASGLDLAVTQAVASGHGFPWRDAWLTRTVLHEGGRLLAAFGVLGLLLHALWSRSARPRPRWAALGGVLLNLATVPALKRTATTSCPWDLAQFGGSARYVPHWDWGVLDLGPGHCFPSGHAVAGFAFLALYFAWRAHHPRRARGLLWTALATGLAFGAAQVLRGAHYVSHVAWSAWLCWTLSASVSALGRQLDALRQRRRSNSAVSRSNSALIPEAQSR